MKKNHTPTPLLITFSLIASLLSSCSQSADQGIEMVISKGTMIPKINIEQIEKKKIVNLSDWFEDFHLVVLEATENSLIETVLNTYVGENDIIVSTMRSGILHFTSDGKFVKCLVKRGHGPGEIFEINPYISIDEGLNKAYFTVSQKQKILCVDIPSGQFDYISFANTGPEPFYDRPIIKDTLIYCATRTFTGQLSTHPVFCQTTSGNLIWEVIRKAPKNSPNARTFMIDDQLYFKYTRGDTLFSVSEGNLSPHLIISSSNPRATFPKVEENQVDYDMIPLFTDWFDGYFTYIEEVDWEQQREGFPKIEYSKKTRFLFNQKTKELFRYGESFVNDYWGFTDDHYLFTQPNGTVFMVYEALDLVELADSVLALDSVNPEVRKRLETIHKRIKAEDNPCLLIGRLKEGI